MNKLLSALLASAILIAGCQTRGFKKSLNGLEYKIIKGDGGAFIKPGNTIKFVTRQYYADSLMANPAGTDSIPQMVQIDSMNLPPAYINIFTEARKGDSVIVRILTDSLMKKTQLPPFAKKGNYFSTRFKILDIYTDTASANKERANLMQQAMAADSVRKVQQKVKDDQILSDYLKTNNITGTVKSPAGVYVLITDPGTGPLIDTGKAVTVNYKGTNLQGKIFDQSYNDSGKSVKPYTFVVGQHMAIEGWDDAIKLFRKGGKGKLFVPSVLGYGPVAMSDEIKANENLIFDIEVADVKDGQAYIQAMQEKQRKQALQMQQMREIQKQMQQQKEQGKQPK